MSYGWLDHWDERRAQRGDELKQATDFVLNTEAGFPKATKVTSIADFCDLADQAVTESTFFDEPRGHSSDFEKWKAGSNFHQTFLLKLKTTMWSGRK